MEPKPLVCRYFVRGHWDLRVDQYRCANCGHLKASHRAAHGV